MPLGSQLSVSLVCFGAADKRAECRERERISASRCRRRGCSSLKERRRRRRWWSGWRIENEARRLCSCSSVKSSKQQREGGGQEVRGRTYRPNTLILAPPSQHSEYAVLTAPPHAPPALVSSARRPQIDPLFSIQKWWKVVKLIKQRGCGGSTDVQRDGCR